MLRSLIAFSQYGFPKQILAPSSAMERLRSHSFDERFRHKAKTVRWMLKVWCGLTYPFISINTSFLAVKSIRRRQADVSWTEFLRVYALALLRNIPPTEYDVYEFHNDQQRASAADYLYWTDTPALLWLNKCKGADNEDVQDKARFAALCAQHSLRHIPVLAEFRSGRQVSGESPQELAKRGDLWVKPTRRTNSQGAMSWSSDGVMFRNQQGVGLTLKQWEQTLFLQDCIVQSRAQNHPDLQRATNGAVVVVRINTVLSDLYGAEWIGAGAAFPFGPLITTSGAIGSSLDSDGVVNWAYHPTVDVAKGHPDTGIPLIGLVVPRWQEALSLVLRAHRDAFPRFASLGWDVVISEGGPVLLETNSGWGALGQQKLHGPLGQSAFRQVLDEMLVDTLP